MSRSIPVILLSLILTSNSYGQANTATEPDKQISIVTTIKPLQLIAQAIVDGRGSVTALLPTNQSPHHYALTPSDRFAIANGDLLIWVGPALESFLIATMDKLSQSKNVITALTLENLVLHEFGENQTDPHFWLDPGNALIVGEAIRELVSTLDEDNASQYLQNTNRFRQAITELNNASQPMQSLIKSQPYTVYHNAYQYLEHYYDFQHGLALVEDPEIQPGIRAMIATREAIKRLQPRCLFSDVETNESVVNTLLEGRQIERRELDPLGEAVAVNSEAYVVLIKNLLQTMSSCFDQD